jgi:hypothetical protein
MIDSRRVLSYETVFYSSLLGSMDFEFDDQLYTNRDDWCYKSLEYETQQTLHPMEY